MISEEEFNDRVGLLKRKDPTNPLLPVLRAYSPMAVTYLEHAMRGLEVNEEARPQVRRMGDLEEEPIDSPEWDALQLRKAQLYGRRFNLSNQFHDHTAAEDRPHDRYACANISDEIGRIQLAIRQVQRQIYHYQRTGELVKEAPKAEREYEGMALWRRYRTVRQNMNRWTTRIKLEGAQQDPATQRAWEKKRRDYEYEFEGLKKRVDEESL